MSETSQNIVINIGPDPRHWPEFSAIREEINKINHPARPEVNWRLIESLALTLFRNNGVDLHSAIYYTLARTQRNGLVGFTEGTELLSGMVVSQWEKLWPEQPQARSEILEWFNARVGNQLRQHEFSNDDLRLVYRAERALQLLCDKLQQVELKKIPRIDNLLYLMQNTAKRLEAVNEVSKKSSSAPPRIPSMVYLSVSDPEPVFEPVRTLFSAVEPQQKEDPQPDAEQSTLVAPLTRRYTAMWGFAGGVCLSMLIVAAAYFAQATPSQQQLAALAAKPEGAALLWLDQPNLAKYSEQLNNLENISPLAGLRTADSSVAMARNLWPTDPIQIAETQRRERLLESRMDTSGIDNGYFQLQQRLQALSTKLIEQEQARGSVTISYLKTAIYQMQSELNREIPLEELLRQLSVAVESNQPPSPVLIKQIDERWSTLLSRYHRLTLQADDGR